MGAAKTTRTGSFRAARRGATWPDHVVLGEKPAHERGRLWSTLGVTAVDGQNWTRPYTFQINATGLWKVQFLLFKDGGSLSASLAPVGFGNQKAVFIDRPRFEVEQRRKGIRERVNTSPPEGPRPGQTPCDCG